MLGFDLYWWFYEDKINGDVDRRQQCEYRAICPWKMEFCKKEITKKCVHQEESLRREGGCVQMSRSMSGWQDQIRKMKNIARGTTNPEYWLFYKFGQCGSTCISSKFYHQLAILALVTNLATRWRHLHLMRYLVDNFATNSCKIVHQIAPLVLVANLATRWRYLH